MSSMSISKSLATDKKKFGADFFFFQLGSKEEECKDTKGGCGGMKV